MRDSSEVHDENEKLASLEEEYASDEVPWVEVTACDSASNLSLAQMILDSKGIPYRVANQFTTTSMAIRAEWNIPRIRVPAPLLDRAENALAEVFDQQEIAGGEIEMPFIVKVVFAAIFSYMLWAMIQAATGI